MVFHPVVAQGSLTPKNMHVSRACMEMSKCIPFLHITIRSQSKINKIETRKTKRVEEEGQGRRRRRKEEVLGKEMEKNVICNYEYVKTNPTIIYNYNALNGQGDREKTDMCWV